MGRQSGQQVQWRFRELVVTALTHDPALLKVAAASRATAKFLAGGALFTRPPSRTATPG